jgi:hypothetical protein
VLIDLTEICSGGVRVLIDQTLSLCTLFLRRFSHVRSLTLSPEQASDHGA